MEPLIEAAGEIIDIGGGSFIEFHEGLLPASRRLFRQAWSHVNDADNKIFGATSSTKRLQAFYSETKKIKGYKFANQISKRVGKISDYPGYDSFKDIVDSGYNGLLVNYYGPKSVIADHSDDMTHIVRDSPVITISWYDMSSVPKKVYNSRSEDSGAPYRRFQLTPKKEIAGHKKITFNLFNGDILIMRGNCQKTHTHKIMNPRKLPKHIREELEEDNVPNLCEQNNRISLTFRKHLK